MILIIIGFYFIGFCYIKSMPKVNFKLEWLADLVMTIVWPYFFFIRLFKYIRLYSEIKINNLKQSQK